MTAFARPLGRSAVTIPSHSGLMERYPFPPTAPMIRKARCGWSGQALNDPIKEIPHG